ncbi:major centromere autoantigen B-like isoform X3 [Centruroides sculpturatus]|uniref:major centromere autoantigen B-like isoform X3 n=1 Tax=Centruroides sculpturatus TaxID=218467 RepID=UPI000C6CD506|nr:major centromere autoantigen B-like isoform X3 [Centruroides sculpturatus]
MESKKKRKILTLTDKLEILAQVDANLGPKICLANRLGLPPSTLNTIIKKRKFIEENAAKCGPYAKKRKKMKTTPYEELENVLTEWLKEAKEHRLPMNSNLLKEKALDIATKLGMYDFKASNGWIDRFKQRNALYASLIKKNRHDDVTTSGSASVAGSVEVEEPNYTDYTEIMKSISTSPIKQENSPDEDGEPDILLNIQNNSMSLEDLSDPEEILPDSSNQTSSYNVPEISSSLCLLRHREKLSSIDEKFLATLMENSRSLALPPQLSATETFFASLVPYVEQLSLSVRLRLQEKILRMVREAVEENS